MSLLHMATAQKDTSKKTTQQDATHTKAKSDTTSKSLGQKPTDKPTTQQEPSSAPTGKGKVELERILASSLMATPIVPETPTVLPPRPMIDTTPTIIAPQVRKIFGTPNLQLFRKFCVLARAIYSQCRHPRAINHRPEEITASFSRHKNTLHFE